MKPGRGVDISIAIDVTKELNWSTGDYHAVPQYSTDIAAAWQLVEAMRNRFHCKVNLMWLPSGFVVRFFNDDISAHGDGATAPLAICLAALKAVGVEVGDA